MRESEERIDTKVLLVGVDTGEEPDYTYAMEELAALAQAAYKRVVGVIVQNMETVNKSFYIGTGKVEEVRDYARECGAEEILFDNTLSPSHVRNLGKELELPILDRTNLILDIFAIRARTREAKLQVEAARLQYMLPRLVGMRENLSRQGGTGGSMSNKGAGETKLELDRRKIEHRISELKKELETVSKERGIMRKRRSRSQIPQVALVGYTNAGKSTILNHLVEQYGEGREKTVREKDMLFATLHRNVRCIHTGDHKPFFLVDTVGFLHRLPPSLVQAFRSTLEEVVYADLLIHVVDYSDPHYRQQMEVTEDTLRELGAGDIPRIVVYNKVDKCPEVSIPRRRDRRIYLAAATGTGLDELTDMIKEVVYAGHEDTCFLVPYDKGNVVAYFMEHSTVLEQEYREGGVWLRTNCHKGDSEKYREYRCG